MKRLKNSLTKELPIQVQHPRRLDIGMVDQDLRECCHAMLFAFVG